MRWQPRGAGWVASRLQQLRRAEGIQRTLGEEAKGVIKIVDKATLCLA